MKNILMIATGGTIASCSSENGLVPKILSDQLLDAVPEIKAICRVSSIQPFNLDSTNMRPGQWLVLEAIIKDNYDKYDGFVITHGTDTMAYTAAAISYLVQNSKKPIILTGAQIPMSEKNTDAARNLIDAFIYAADDNSHGVSIVFSGSVICGTRARKNFTKRFDAFGSVNFPELARLQSGKILRFINDDIKGEAQFYEFLNPNVGLLKLVPALRLDVMEYLLEQYDGIVIESFGVGGIPEYSDFNAKIFEAVEKGKIIILTTQVPNEGSDISVYHVGNAFKNKEGIIEAYDMTTEAAFVKLMWSLGISSKQDEVRKLFYTRISYDILNDGK